MAKGNYKAAIKKIPTKLATQRQREATLLKGRALYLNKEYTKAISLYSKILQQTDTLEPAFSKCHFGIAQSYEQLKDFKKAEAHFATGLSVLTSQKMREKVANEFYREAKVIFQKDAEISLSSANTLFDLAMTIAQKGSLHDEILFTKGKAHLEKEDTLGALSVFHTLIDSFPQSNHYWDCMHTAMPLFRKNDLRSQLVLRTIEKNSPNKKMRAESLWKQAQLLQMPNPTSTATLYKGIHVLDSLIRKYPNFDKIDDARFFKATAALSKNIKHPMLADSLLQTYILTGTSAERKIEIAYLKALSLEQQSRYKEAMKAYEQFLAQNPFHEKTDIAHKRIEQIWWSYGKNAYDEKKWKAAILNFEEYLAKYPEKKKAPQGYYKKALAKLNLNDTTKALLEIDSLKIKYPESQWNNKGQILKAQILLHKDPSSKTAQKLLEQYANDSISKRLSNYWGEKSLVIEPTSPFLTDEKISLTCQFQGLDSVIFDIYSIDEEQYFKDKRSMRDIASIAIDLCKPHKSHLIKVKYPKSKTPVEEHITLPITQAGIYLVRVRGENLEAVTTISISDFQALLKQTNKGTLLFVQNKRTGEKVSGATVLLSNSSDIVTEGKTDKNGIFQTFNKNSHIQNSNSFSSTYSAFVTLKDQVCWIDKGSHYSGDENQWYQKNRIFTDKSLYTIEDTTFITIVPSLSDTEEVHLKDSTGTVIAYAKVLPASKPFLLKIPPHRHKLGSYKVSLTSSSKELFNSSYKVGENSFVIKEKDYEVSIHLEDSLIKRGEPIKGKVQIQSYKKSPINNLTAGVSLYSFSTKVKTDSVGIASFEIPYDRGRLSDSLFTLSVSIDAIEKDVYKEIRFYEQEYAYAIETPEILPENISGKITVKTHSPLPKQNITATLQLFKENSIGEKLHFSQQYNIHSDTLLTITTPKLPAGKYRAQIQSRDSKANFIFDEHFFSVSATDMKDSTIFEIELLDTLYTPSEKLRAKVHTNLRSGNILCTFETDSIISYYTLPIKNSMNEISLPLGPKMVPNVIFTASVFDNRNGLQTFTKEIKVSKELKIAIDSLNTPTAGDSITISLNTSDINNKPQESQLVVFVHEDQWGVESPDNYYSSLYKDRFHAVTDFYFDTLPTSRRFGHTVAGVSTEYRENRIGFLAFEKIRKELTKAAKEEYAGIGFGSGYGSGFGGGGGGMSLNDLSGSNRLSKTALKSRGVRKIKRLRKHLGNHFKEYWIATTIQESEISTDASGQATFTIHIPDSIKDGITISAIAMNASGYIGSTQSSISIQNKPASIPENTPVSPMVSESHKTYDFSLGAKSEGTVYNSVADFIRALPRHSYYNSHPLYAMQLLLEGDSDSALFTSVLLSAMKKKADFAEQLSILRLLQRVPTQADWVGIEEYQEAQLPSLLESIKEKKDEWFIPLSQMEQVALIDPQKVPLIRLQKADREKDNLTAHSLAALMKVWHALNREDKVKELTPMIEKNLTELLKSDTKDIVLLCVSIEALYHVNSSHPLLKEAVTQLVEKKLTDALHNPNQMLSIIDILHDYYKKKPQQFAIKQTQARETEDLAIAYNRQFFEIPQKFLGSYLYPDAVFPDGLNDAPWQVDSIHEQSFVLVKASVDAEDEKYLISEQIPPHATYVTAGPNVTYCSEENAVVFSGKDTTTFFYVIQVTSKEKMLFSRASDISRSSESLGIVDTLHVVPASVALNNPVSPYILLEKGDIAYERELYETALPLYEKGRDVTDEDTALVHDLLNCAIGTRQSSKIVTYFEELKEQSPYHYISFDNISKIQKAYQDMKLHESGYLLNIGTAESRFIEEMNIIGKLEAISPKKKQYPYKRTLRKYNDEPEKINTLSSIETMKKVIASYPHGKLHARSLYLFSHLLYDRIDNADELTKEDKNRLLIQIQELLFHYLAEYPYPLDKENAKFTIASASLDDKQLEKAIQWTFKSTSKTEEEMLQTVEIIKAYAHFLRNDFSKAKEICLRIRDEKSTDHFNRELATYILAQIYHGLGNMKEALPLYEEVASTFVDASQVFAASQTRVLELPEIVSLSPNEKTITVGTKNIDSLRIKTYSIDLFRYLEKNKYDSELSSINLSGIKPLYSKKLMLPKRVGITQKRDIETGITKNGAYLTFVQTGDTTLYTIIIKGDLQLSTNKTSSSTLHLSVENNKAKPVEGATILIKDSDRILKGESDKRGIFQTASSNSSPTVIAIKGDSYGAHLEKRAPRTVTFNEVKKKKSSYQSASRFIQKQRKNKGKHKKAFFNQEIFGVMIWRTTYSEEL